KTFDQLVVSLHDIYGTIYESVDEKTLSSSVEILKDSYFSVFLLEDNQKTIKMTSLSHRILQLPPNPPVFERGNGITGRVIDSEESEIFVPRVELFERADLNCKSYWNKILSTQRRYFYGKQIEFGGKVAILVIIGARTPYFQEQIFLDTIKNLFDVLADFIYISDKKNVRLLSTQKFSYKLTEKIIAERGPETKNVFLVIRFIDNDKYKNIRQIIKSVLAEHGLNMLVADDRSYHHTLGMNLEAYMNSCKYCIAILDSIDINANIAYELGYMRSSLAECLILKDKNVGKLNNADFVHQIFEPVDLDNLETIRPKIEKWLYSLGITKFKSS
ncbi:MAG: hypothetical protein AAGA80_24425, partial [Cyanobacteria bacterium P01_F01_bin.143]